jgi:hypothetical protein
MPPLKESRNPAVTYSTTTACPVNCQAGDDETENAQISDVWNISPNVINEARFGYTWAGSFFGNMALGKGYASKLGWAFAKADTLPTIQLNSYVKIQPQSNSVYKQHIFDPSDVVTMIHGKHILHFGAELLFYRDDSTQWGNTNPGSMSFSGAYTQQWTVNASGVAQPDTSATGVDYADFLLGLSGAWGAGISPEYGGRMKTPEIFIQDDYKLRPNLTINIGLCYDISHGWNEIRGNEMSFDPTVPNPASGGMGGYWFGTTHANGRRSLQANIFNTFLPRLGFSWQPRTNTTVRAGFGVYDHMFSLDRYGSGLGTALGTSGNANDQTSGISPVVKLGGDGTIYGTTTPLPYLAPTTDPSAFNGQGAGYSQFHTPVQKVNQWNAAIQRELRTNLVAEISYVGSHGFNLIGPTDFNAVPVTKLSSNDAQYRPYQQYQNIGGNFLDGISNYNSLQSEITKRLTSGLSFSFNYVWSHFLDDQDSAAWGGGAGSQPYQIANNTHANYSNSNFDKRHALKGSVVYQLPIGKGKQFLNNNSIADAVIGGWQITGTMAAFSGSPFTVYADGVTYEMAQGSSQIPNWNKGELRIKRERRQIQPSLLFCIAVRESEGPYIDLATNRCRGRWLRPFDPPHGKRRRDDSRPFTHQVKTISSKIRQCFFASIRPFHFDTVKSFMTT